ncbi:MAG: excisionase family DNA-binding protein [Bdellovibrionales bacterium]|nr:excisionase family DNA-binding protein [Bdellovibrionales bacterium]
MTASEVAERLGVSRMTVHRLVEKGLLTCTRTRGRHSRFSELNLKAYERKHCMKKE